MDPRRATDGSASDDPGVGRDERDGGGDRFEAADERFERGAQLFDDPVRGLDEAPGIDGSWPPDAGAEWSNDAAQSAAGYAGAPSAVAVREPFDDEPVAEEREVALQPAAPPISPGRDTRRVLAAICPYLLSDDGAWRAARPMREHRCTAVRPPAILPLNKQRNLCLIDAHHTCPAYLAAQERRAATLAEAGISERALAARQSRPVARTVPVALDRPSAVPGSAALTANYRRLAQLGLAALMLLAAAVFILARIGDGGDRGTAAASPTASAQASLAATPSAEPSPSTERTPRPTASPDTAEPSPTRRPRRTYTVRAGDTLSAIADRFNTTVERLQELNDIDDPSLIEPGQVLRIR